MRKAHVVYATVAALVFAVFAAWTLLSAPFWSKSLQDNVVTLEDNRITIEIADTPSLRELGLSGRTSLAPDSGMLFVFPTDGKYSFWMKDMRFSIDMLWLSADGAVVYIKPRVSPDTYPQSFVSNSPARYVLELLAGYVQQHGVTVGDKVQL